MGYKEMVKELLYQSLQTMTVEEFNKYLEEEKNGYIKINKHPEDENIVICNYTAMTTFEKRWNKETMSSRGLILDLTNAKDNGIIYILAKPFDKFPNFGSNEIIGYEDDIDFSETPIVMEKMDGSLGISYFFKGEIRFATRGSFTSEQAIRATEIWRKKYSKYFHDQFITSTYAIYPYTLLVEIIYPENRVVVDYNGMEDLVMLGIIDIYKKDYGREWSYYMCKNYVKTLGMPIAKQYDLTVNKLLEMKKSISANEEGWILRFSNNKRLKIKGDEYLKVHRIKCGMSTKAKYKVWAEGKLQEYIMMLPEEFRGELEEFEAQVEKLTDSKFFMLQTILDHAIAKTNGNKAFAQYLKSVVNPEYHKFLFKGYQTKTISRQMIKDEIAKNYDQYEEVINVWNKNQDF
jgi:RNA ligase